MIIFKALCQSTKIEMEIKPFQEWGMSFSIKDPESFENAHEIVLNTDEVEALIEYLNSNKVIPLMFPMDDVVSGNTNVRKP